MTVTAVVVSHANRAGLERMIGILDGQTRPPDEILAYCSGYPNGELVELAQRYRHVRFHDVADRDDWGHEKRATGLASAVGEWVGFFNDDDFYEPHYLERMLMAAEDGGTDVVYCAWNEQPDCVFAFSRSTAGNFLVRTRVGRQAGYPCSRVYENDGHFIEAVRALTGRIVKVDDRTPLLYLHNA